MKLTGRARRSRALFPQDKPRFVEPMKPRLLEPLPTTKGDWAYELKFDGIRLIAVRDGLKSISG